MARRAALMPRSHPRAQRMRFIEEINVPQPLIEAHRSGDLVLFVGAGVSLDAPSGLPLFDGLARELAELAQQPYGDAPRIDEFLGRLDKLIDVRAHTAARVSRDSEPNDTHKALVALALSGHTPRIITTNFDDHIAEAAEASDAALVPLHVGPALPNGREFRGLVHLHGRAKTDEARLIVTDRDFGRAYLNEAWATRFLQDVFLNRTVLFIGYSHNDLVMDYLAMGLPSDTRRFALVSESDQARWSRLQVKTVAYPDGEYETIPRLLNAWADFAAEEPLTARDRVRALVARAPSELTASEDDYLAWAVTTSIGAYGFLEGAATNEWLMWLRKQRVFARLFDPDASYTSVGRLLGTWFAAKFVAAPDRQGIALDTVRFLGGELSEQLWNELVIRLVDLEETSPEIIPPWRTYLDSRLHLRRETSGGVVRRLSLFANGGSDRRLALLRRAAIPFAKLEPDTWANFFKEDGVPAKPEMKLAWVVDGRELRGLLNELRDDLPAVANDVVDIFEQALLDAMYLQSSFDGEPRRRYFMRSSIADHEQNRERGIEDVLVDGLRDAALALPAHAQQLLIERWTPEIQHAVFRRLGLHLASVTDVLDMREKTDLALSVLFEFELKHEVFELIANIAQNDAEVRRLIDAVNTVDFAPEGETPEDIARERRIFERSKFDRLDWISRHTTLDDAAGAFRKVREANPDMAPREHPDHDSWLSGGVLGGVPPMPVEEFLQLVDDDFARAMTEVVHDYPEHEFSQPTWEDALQLLYTAVTERPDLGVAMVAWTRENPERAEDIDQLTLRAWADAPSDATLPWEAILAELTVRAADPAGSEVRSALLVKFAAVPMSDRPGSTTDIARAVTTAMLAQLPGPAETDEPAVPSWPANIAGYWLREAISLYEAQQPLATAVEGVRKALNTPGAVGLLVLRSLASELTRWWALDEAFARAHIGSVVLGRTPHSLSYQEAAWEGFFDARRRAPREFITDEFYRRLSELRYWFRRTDQSSFLEPHRAWVIGGLNDPEITDETRDILIDSYIVNDDIDELRKLLQLLGWRLEDGSSEQVWTPWLTSVIRRRAQGIPRRLTDDEASSWNDLALHAGEHLEAALEPLNHVRAPLSGAEDFDPLESLSPADHPRFASAVAQNLAHRIDATADLNGQVISSLGSLVSAVRPHLSVDELRHLTQRAIRADYYEAVSWLDEVAPTS